ncbi:5492_t:CDS:2, partial [Racocetra fulgida]
MKFDHLNDYIKIGQSFVVAGFIKFESNVITLEATDIDYLTLFDTNYNISVNPSSTTSNSKLDISIIANKFKSANSSIPLKKCQRLVPTPTTNDESLTSVILFQELTPISTKVIANKKEKKNISDIALDTLGLSTYHAEENHIEEDKLKEQMKKNYMKI